MHLKLNLTIFEKKKIMTLKTLFKWYSNTPFNIQSDKRIYYYLSISIIFGLVRLLTREDII